MTVSTAVAIERYPDRSAVAYCGPWSLVLAFDDPIVETITAECPWSVSLYSDADDPIVVFVAPEPAEADSLFTSFTGHLAAFDGSIPWEEHIGSFFTT